MKLLILLCFFPFISFAKTLLISDIDDTIKHSHVLSSKDKVLNAYKTDLVFRGMSELYWSILKNIPDSEVVYLSNAPKKLMGFSHNKFIDKNFFPLGEILLRGEESPVEFKLLAIRELIADKQPTRILFFGDNGENDIYFYNQIEREFPQIEIHTFIRTLYSQRDFSDRIIYSLQPKQIGFVTPLEPLYWLTVEGLIAEEDWLLLSLIYSSQIMDEDVSVDSNVQFFPTWQRCQFQSKNMKAVSDIRVLKALYRVESVCQQSQGRR